MKSTSLCLFLTLPLLAFLGCGQQTETTPAADAHGHSAPHPAEAAADPGDGHAALPGDTPPDQIIAAFLDALRGGDNALAESLLTTTAREETSKRNLTVQPPGSPSARFQIGAPEYLDANRVAAHVKSVWIEYVDGSPISYDIVWALRRQDDGWRIAGMATQLVDGQPAVFLNFEDPDDMLAKWTQADQMAGESSPAREARQTAPGQPPQRR